MFSNLDVLIIFTIKYLDFELQAFEKGMLQHRNDDLAHFIRNYRFSDFHNKNLKINF